MYRSLDLEPFFLKDGGALRAPPEPSSNGQQPPQEVCALKITRARAPPPRKAHWLDAGANTRCQRRRVATADTSGPNLHRCAEDGAQRGHNRAH
tara:strand:+ start:951 stop:1232 length:282 start_codon:yes stop_codon:yes gene_type:complete